jgi:hypothetical protein
VSGGVRHVTISGVSVVNPQAGFLWVEATDNVSIGSVVIDAPSVTGLQTLQLSIRRRPGTQFSILDLGDVSCNPSANFTISLIEVQGTISGNITADSINEITAEGSIFGDIKSEGSALFPGAIARVESFGGNLIGNIEARNQIATIRASFGSIGSAATQVSIRSGTQINNIEAEAVYANINNQILPNVDSGVLYMKTTAGPFVGQLLSRQIETTVANPSGLDIHGNLDADIILGTQNPTTSPGRIEEPIYVGGGFPSNRRIECKGITSQIVFNQSNAGFPIAGTIKVNGWNVSPLPYYNQTRSAIGGGSIGLVPYQIHYAECTPSAPFNQPGVAICTYHATGGQRNSITLEHYGRVGFRSNGQWTTQPAAGTMAIQVHRRLKLTACNSPWEDVTATGPYSAVINPDSSRGLIVTGPFTDANYYYRIKPLQQAGAGVSLLYCRDTDNDANPPVVGEYEYIYLPVVESAEAPPCEEC